ncbi:hypothetical protein CPC08DRAFT_769884 [Agrocybe pediades]|nr:hypothetical protein CPC08DRAFT_769884 [Agrocybe pediades]
MIQVDPLTPTPTGPPPPPPTATKSIFSVFLFFPAAIVELASVSQSQGFFFLGCGIKHIFVSDDDERRQQKGQEADSSPCAFCSTASSTTGHYPFPATAPPLDDNNDYSFTSNSGTTS